VTRELGIIIMLVVMVLALAGAAWGFARRRKAGLRMPSVPAAELVNGEVTARFSLLHVATTLADLPLQRVWQNPLAFRAKTELEVCPDGLRLTLAGEGQMGLPASMMRGVSRATWTIDKAVDPEGLLVITWALGDTLVDSYFRSVDQPAEDVIAALQTPLTHPSTEDTP
jgi:hypothetical protein